MNRILEDTKQLLHHEENTFQLKEKYSSPFLQLYLFFIFTPLIHTSLNLLITLMSVTYYSNREILYGKLCYD